MRIDITVRGYRVSLLLLLLIGLFNMRGQAAAPVEILTAPASGVVGYEMGIFGSGFGAQQGDGRVTVGGLTATVLEWREQMIRAVIPPASNGITDLVVEANGASAVWPVEIYSIDPAFTTRVDELQNIAVGKGVYFSEPAANVYIGESPSSNLSRNDTINPGYLDCRAGQIFAVNLGQPLSEPVWWTMYGGTDGWPPFNMAGRARSYTIEGSNNSTNGMDGTWQVLHSVAYSERVSVTHKVTLANHSWVRMKVSAVLNNTFFRVYEIRVHKRVHSLSNGRTDSFGILGDSLTYADFGYLHSQAFFPAILGQKRGSAAEMLLYPVGLVGAQASTLSAANTEEWAFPRILSQIPDVDFWGFAFGTNDSLSEWDVQNYQQYAREGIEQALALGKAPMLARLPDTGPEGFGRLEHKLTILKAIDALNAEYRLIPGPDLYTAFRKNILYEGMTYLSDDQTHHSGEGSAAVLDLWAEALLQSGIYSGTAAGGPPAANGGLATGGRSGVIIEDGVYPLHGWCKWLIYRCQQRR